MTLTLYTRYQNSAGERVRIALNLKGIAYTYVSVDGLEPGAYAQINPQDLRPALAIGDRIVAQSSAILEWLEETHPTPPLLPADPLDRAEVRAFAQHITADMHPLNNRRVIKYLGTDMNVSEELRRRWYHHWMAVGLANLEAMLARRAVQSDYCYGGTPGWADLHLAPQLANARRFDCDLAPYPRLCAVDDRCRQHPAFIAAATENQPDYPGAQ